MYRDFLIFAPVVLAAVIFICFATFVYLRARRQRTDLKSLIKATELMGGGAYDLEIDSDLDGDMGRLATALHEAADAIKERTQSYEYLNKVVDEMDASLIVVDHEGVIKIVNKATTSLLGYSRAELVGQPFMVITGKRVKGEVESSEDIRYQSKDGRSIPVHFSSSELAVPYRRP